MTIVNRLTHNDFAELRAVLCPYCRANLTSHSDAIAPNGRGVFVHTIPGTEHAFPCGASVLRAERSENAASYRMPAE